MLKYEIYFALFILAAWLVAWFVWLRPWLKKYQLTAGVLAHIEREELAGWSWLRVRLRGAWSAILLFVTSMVTGCWGLLMALVGVDPSTWGPFQSSDLWKALLSDEMALKASALATLAATFLTLFGKLKDIRTVPQTTPALIPSGGNAEAPQDAVPAAVAPVVAPVTSAVDPTKKA